jgi:F-box/leucine-rich repeat protein 2/20
MSQNLAISEGFDLSYCGRLTNQSLAHIDRMNNVKVLTLNYCSKITDAGLTSVRTLFGKLQVLSLEGLTLISDEGLRPFAEKCKNLQTVNVNKCPNISHESLAEIARRNPFLSTLGMSDTRVGDEAFSLICAAMQEGGCGKNMTSMDISNCRELTDLGVNCMAEVCPSLTRLNMSGLCRVSDIGVRAVCANCWHLQYLNVSDIFLLRDDAFWFSATYDGRRAANENMLVSLQTIIFTDCSNLTDRGIEGLAERCRKLDVLVLQGCDKVTDLSLRHIADSAICTSSSTPMCDTIHTLNLSYCTGITGPGILALLPVCACLEDLDLSGLASIVNDAFLLAFSKSCPTLQKLTLQKCLLLSDAALCALADNLWLEHLDVSGCAKITDSGVEVLTEACNGLRSVAMRRAKRLTNKSLFALMRNCKGIQKVDLRECPLITAACAEEARSIKAAVSLQI